MWKVELGVARYRTLKLREGILVPEGRLEGILWPFRNPTLPTDFYNVRDAKTAIEFCREYAPLGYDCLTADKVGGDPLEWVLTHAGNVRFVLDMVYALGQHDASSLYDLVRDNALEVHLTDTAGQPVGSPITGLFRTPHLLKYAAGCDYRELILWLPAQEQDILDIVPGLVTDIVNDNTQNMGQELWSDVRTDGTQFLWVHKFRSLLEAIWSMVGDLAVKGVANPSRLRRCEWCGAIFEVTDKRQKFCPPVESPFVSRQQSPCGLSYRQKKLRDKASGGTS